jgi:hypothetical protein
MILNVTDRKPLLAGPDQQPKNLQPGRIPQLLQTARGMSGLHVDNLAVPAVRVNYISRIIELFLKWLSLI